MTRRRTWGIALGGAAVAALLLFGALQLAGRELVAAAPSIDRADDAQLEIEPQPRVSPPAQVETARVEPAPEQPVLEVHPQEPSAGSVSGVRVLVRGIVRAPVPDLETTTIQARVAGSGFGRRPVFLKPDPMGRFEWDATPYLTASASALSAGATELVVQASHRHCIPAVVSRDLPAEVWPDTGAGGSPDRVIEVDLTLERATCITGTVGVPLGIDVKSAAVTVFVLRSTGEWATYKPRWVVEHPARASLTIDSANAMRPVDDGSYTIRVEPGAIYGVVAALPGFRPQKRAVETALPGDYRADFALERGEVLRGTLCIDGPPVGSGMTVSAALHCPDAGHVSLGSGLGTLCWVDGELEWAHAIAKTDARGRFELSGLCPRSYALRAVGLGVSGQNARSVQIGEARAPADDVALGPVLARAVLDFGNASGKAAKFSLRTPLESGPPSDLGPFEPDDDGLAQLSLPPHSTYEVVADGALLGRISTASVGSSMTWRIGDRP